MVKKLVLALIIFLVLIGCQSLPSRQVDAKTPVSNFRTGSQGLRISFVPNMPPFRVFDTDDLNVVVEVENMGAFTTTAVGDTLYLSGFNPYMITGIETSGRPIPVVEGKSAYVSRGAVDRVVFKGVPAMLSAKGIDKYPIKLLATACYSYDTVATANICIDPNPYSLSTKQKVCTPRSVGLGSQGAPIAVNNIKVEASPGKTRLKIDISNVGGGEVFKPGLEFLELCSPYTKGLGFDEIDFVQVLDVSLPGYSILGSCKPLINGFVRLINNRATFYCEVITQGQSTYMSPVTIKLGYGYRNSIFKDLELVAIQ